MIVNGIYLGNWLKKNAVILKYRLIYIRKITHNNQLFQGQLTVIYQLVSTKSDLDPGNGLGKGHKQTRTTQEDREAKHGRAEE